MDLQITQYITTIRTAELTFFMLVFTEFASWYTAIFVFIVYAAYKYLTSKKRHDIYLLSAALIIPPLLGSLIKELIQRPRPSMFLAIAEEPSYAMPSNHALIAAGFYGMLFWLIIRNVKSSRTRVLLYIPAIFFILLIAFLESI